MHCLIPLDRPPRSVKGSETLTGIDPSFNRAVVLFHDMVQVRTDPTVAPATEFTFLLQFGHNLGIRGVAVDVDDPGARMTRSSQSLLKETLGGSGITPGCQQEID